MTSVTIDERRRPTSEHIHTLSTIISNGRLDAKRVHQSPSCFVPGGVFEVGGSNGVISGWIKSKMAAGGHVEKVQTAVLLQRITLTRFTLC